MIKLSATTNTDDIQEPAAEAQAAEEAAAAAAAGGDGVGPAWEKLFDAEQPDETPVPDEMPPEPGAEMEAEPEAEPEAELQALKQATATMLANEVLTKVMDEPEAKEAYQVAIDAVVDAAANIMADEEFARQLRSCQDFLTTCVLERTAAEHALAAAKDTLKECQERERASVVAFERMRARGPAGDKPLFDKFEGEEKAEEAEEEEEAEEAEPEEPAAAEQEVSVDDAPAEEPAEDPAPPTAPTAPAVPQDPNAWKDFPIQALVDLGLSKATAAKLAEQGMDTLGKLSARCNTPEGLDGIPGIGPKKRDAIVDAFGEFWTLYPEFAQAAADEEIGDPNE